MPRLTHDRTSVNCIPFIRTAGFRISTKLMGLLAIVVLAGASITLITVTRVTRAQFLGYVQESDRIRAEELALVLAEYHQATGGFGGVGELLRSRRPAGIEQLRAMREMHDQHGMTRRQRFPAVATERTVIVDRTGTVLVDTRPREGDGDRLPPGQGVPVLSGGEPVARVYVGSMITSAFNPLQEQFLRAVRRAVLFSTAMVSAVALVLGVLFVKGITGPLQALSRAAATIAGGELAVDLPATGRDEVGVLAESFRTMLRSLEDARSQRERMFRDIAHELRTPVTLLRGEVEAMLDGIYPIDATSIRSLQDEIRQLDRLVSDVRLLSVLDGGELELHRETVDVPALVQEVCAAFRGRARAVGVTVRMTPVSPSTQVPTVTADRDRILQVLTNLVDNALTHGVTVDAVELTVRREPSHSRSTEKNQVSISVSDNGVGIDPVHRDHVFERLYRVDPSRVRTGGTGLGLTIARDIVVAHGGEIDVTDAPGGGAVFTVRLPGEQTGDGDHTRD